MCDCKTRIEAELTEHFKTKASEATEHKAELMGYGLAVSGKTMIVMGYMPIESTALYPLKKGGTKRKTTKASMFFNFCPFCGVKIPT